MSLRNSSLSLSSVVFENVTNRICNYQSILAYTLFRIFYDIFGKDDTPAGGHKSRFNSVRWRNLVILWTKTNWAMNYAHFLSSSPMSYPNSLLSYIPVTRNLINTSSYIRKKNYLFALRYVSAEIRNIPILPLCRWISFATISTKFSTCDLFTAIPRWQHDIPSDLSS